MLVDHNTNNWDNKFSKKAVVEHLLAPMTQVVVPCDKETAELLKRQAQKNSGDE